MPPIKGVSTTLLATAITHALTVTPVHAATITVNSSADDGGTPASLCTLREAMVSMSTQTPVGGCINTGGSFSDPGVILFDPSLQNSTITLSQSTPLEIQRSNVELTINGPSDSKITISANRQSKVFEFTTGRIALHNLRIIDGNAGGIQMNAGSLSVNHSIVTRNTGGGGIELTGNASLELNDSTISHNTNISGRYGGGVFAHPADTVHIKNSEITNNSARYGGGVGGEIASVTISNSLLADNLATQTGGGVGVDSVELQIIDTTLSGNTAWSLGGGIMFDSNAEVVNTTITNNEAELGGGIYQSGGDVTFRNVTLTHNSADNSGGGAHAVAGSLSLLNSIIVGNQAQGAGAELYQGTQGTIISKGHNLLGSAPLNNDRAFYQFSPITSDAIATQDGLNLAAEQIVMSLGDNGCETQLGATTTKSCVPTQAPALNSPALNRANADRCPQTDQRGVARETSSHFYTVKAKNGRTVVFPLAGDCDVGAVEG